jgi:hypothetical protein
MEGFARFRRKRQWRRQGAGLGQALFEGRAVKTDGGNAEETLRLPRSVAEAGTNQVNGQPQPPPALKLLDFGSRARVDSVWIPPARGATGSLRGAVPESDFEAVRALLGDKDTLRLIGCIANWSQLNVYLDINIAAYRQLR